jgi:hypothetical protein
MRLGSRGSVCRRLLLVALAIVVVGLLAVPVALAANPSMVIAGLVHGQYYGGQRALAATVTVPDPSNPSGAPLATTTTSPDGFFITTVEFAGPPTYNNSFAATASALGPPPALADWSPYFKVSTATATFTFTPGGTQGVFFNLVVKNTRVSGKVRNAATGRALRGVKIAIVGGKSVKTSKKGKYSVLRGLWPATKYKVKFSKSGFKSVTKKFGSAPGSTAGVSVVLTKK